MDGQLAKEGYFAELFHRRCEVPAPWPYLLESSSELFGWPYAIMGRVDGIQVADPTVYASLGTDARAELARALGRTAVEISVVRVDGAGHWDQRAGGIVPFRPEWAQWVRRTVLEQVDRSLGISPADRDWVIGLLDAGEAALAAPFWASLLHGDLSRHNVTARHGTGGWVVAGVYDLSSAHFGHADVNLTRQFADDLDHDPSVALAFLEAGVTADVDPGRFRVLLVLERIGIGEWAKRERRSWWSAELGFREWLGRYLDAVETVG